jgi:hypothetical protein
MSFSGYLERTFLSCCLAASAVQAAPFTLFNTGVDSSGAVLVGGDGVTDSHWVILSGPGLSAPQNAVTYLNPFYIPDSSTSRWISVTSSGYILGNGVYDFQLTFSLAGFDPATAIITGRFSADNHITTTEINGVTVPGLTTDTYTSYTNFVINSGFVAGTNTLDFIVLDDSAPMGLRVDSLEGIADQITTSPEVSTWFSAGTGLLCLIAFARARRRQT